MISCYTIIFLIKTRLFFSINQVGYNKFAKLVAYQQLIKKTIYLAYKT